MGLRMRAPRRGAADATTDAAETALRLAVLLQAGVAPGQAWAYVAAADPAAARVVVATGEGVPLADAVAAAGAGSWRDLAAAFAVASRVGAPLAESLRCIAGAIRDGQEAADAVRIALAEPASTARLMAWLPLVAVGLGIALGFDTLGVLVGQPLGIACLIAGVALMLLARRWSARLVRGARAETAVPGIRAELVAIALSGGVSIDQATAIAEEALGAARRSADGGAVGDVDARVGSDARSGPDARAGPDGRPGDGRAGADDSVDGVLELSRAAGVPAVELLRASAAHARHRARVEASLRAARLSSRLLLPLGACTLPAFLLLGVAPMLLSVMSAVPLSL